jgi:hypothetical protein
MSRETETIEISEMPDVLRLVERVQKGRTARVLSRKDKPVAILRPIGGERKRTKKAISKKNYDAFLDSAGSWKDVDTDTLVKDIYNSRKISSRPPVEL